MKQVDVPITHFGDDRLDRDALIQQLRQMLVREEDGKRRATRLAIGLTGPWGSGKSSVLRLLAGHLGKLANVLVVEFNPWVFQGRDDLLNAFFDEMRAQLGSSGRQNARDIIEALDSYRAAVEPALEVVHKGLGLFAKIIPKAKPQSAVTKRRALEERLELFDGAVVVLIDEVDRIEDDELRAMARLIKAVGDLPNVSYLVAYDRKRVEAALGRGDQAEGAAYLEKIVQFPVPLRPLMSDEAQALLDDALTHAGYDTSLGDRELMNELLQSLIPLIDTPRDIKRLVSSFVAMEPMVKGEVHSVDVLAYAALCTKAAFLRDRIADDIDDVVNDPAGILKLMARGARDEKPTIEMVFGPGVGPRMGQLLTFLFPVFGGQADYQRFGRVQQRRSLLTMLYLGNPPFQASRKEIEAFWTNPATVALTKKRESGALADFTGLIHRLMPELPAGGDAAAWLALAQEAGRGSGDVRSQGRRIARDLRSILVEFGGRDAEARSRAQQVVKTLIAADDFVLVPDTVRYHMFAHGLVANVGERGGPTFFDKDETKELLKQELPRYRAFVEAGRWLDGSQDVDPIFALEQAGAWDAQLRDIAEQQLDSPAGTAAFAALILPPGWAMDGGTVERFVSEERLRARIDSMPPPKDPWLARCVDRVRQALDGESTMFDG